MKFKNYARFKRKNIEQKQEIDYIDSDFLFYLNRSKTFSEQKEYLRKEITFCDIVKNQRRKEKKAALQKELQELEVYSANEL